LTQARTDRAELMDEISALRRVGAREPTTGCARIVKLADRLMSAAPKREAAE
jgi:hypothetical protein